jgi:hypothetical protein
MKTLTDTDFAKLVLDKTTPPAVFRPVVTYDPDGDCLEFLAKPDSFYGERVDDLVTVYRSLVTNEVIGSAIKGVSSFCKWMAKQFPGFGIEIHDGKVRLQHLFLARMWTSKDSVAMLTYQKLLKVAEEVDLEAPVLCA